MTPSNVTPLHPKPASPADLARDAHEQAKGYTSEAENAVREAGETYRQAMLAVADLATLNPARRDLYQRQAAVVETDLRRVASLRSRNP